MGSMSRSKFESAVRDQLGFLGSTRGSAYFKQHILKRLGCLDPRAGVIQV